MRVLRKCFDLVKVLEGAYDGVDPKFGPKNIGLVATSNNGRYHKSIFVCVVEKTSENGASDVP